MKLLLIAALLVVASPVPSPAPSPTPHHWRCIGDPFDADLGPIACWKITPSPSPKPKPSPR
jgi:hypothetical protein